jgi:hypothetical protein
MHTYQSAEKVGEPVGKRPLKQKVSVKLSESFTVALSSCV